MSINNKFLYRGGNALMTLGIIRFSVRILWTYFRTNKNNPFFFAEDETNYKDRETLST